MTSDQMPLDLESSPHALIVFREGVVAGANGRAESLFGYSAGEMMGLTAEDFVPPALREAHRAHRAEWDIEPRTRPMGIGLTVEGVRKDGVPVAVEVEIARVHLREQWFIVAKAKPAGLSSAAPDADAALANLATIIAELRRRLGEC